MKLSARNQLAGTVRGVRKGEAIANVELDVSGQRLVASITIKASDVIIATE
jgi:molybdopterin-binding protein